MKYEEDIIPFLDSEDINRVICSLEYIFANDLSKKYLDRVIGCMDKPEFKHSQENKIYPALVFRCFFDKINSYLACAGDERSVDDPAGEAQKESRME